MGLSVYNSPEFSWKTSSRDISHFCQTQYFETLHVLQSHCYENTQQGILNIRKILFTFLFFHFQYCTLVIVSASLYYKRYGWPIIQNWDVSLIDPNNIAWYLSWALSDKEHIAFTDNSLVKLEKSIRTLFIMQQSAASI